MENVKPTPERSKGYWKDVVANLNAMRLRYGKDIGRKCSPCYFNPDDVEPKSKPRVHKVLKYTGNHPTLPKVFSGSKVKSLVVVSTPEDSGVHFVKTADGYSLVNSAPTHKVIDASLAERRRAFNAEWDAMTEEQRNAVPIPMHL